MSQDVIEENEVIMQVKPKFNLLYELAMPTGKKIKKDILYLIIFFIVTIVTFLYSGKIGGFNSTMLFNIQFGNLIEIVLVIIMLLILIKTIVSIIVQSVQYKHISYKFFKDHMIYEDDFLNQRVKNIDYSNIKELEIRRTVLDRILGFGVIIIYTNAENKRNNGMVIYGIKNPDEMYTKINKIVNDSKNSK